VRARPPSPGWAVLELLLAGALIGAGFTDRLPVDQLLWLLVTAVVLMIWRGPGLRAIGLAWSSTLRSAAIIGVVVGVAYQALSLWVLEPLIAFATSSALPDVSAFQTVAGNWRELAFWIALSWTRAGFGEEVVYRGWILTRLAEVGRFSQTAWAAGAIGSALVFGAAHVYQGVSGVLATALAGLVMAGVYLATGRNLWAAVIAHATMDTTAFVMIYFNIYPGL
jgi:membrane protease YdiL (CAAX protease family)